MNYGKESVSLETLFKLYRYYHFSRITLLFLFSTAIIMTTNGFEIEWGLILDAILLIVLGRALYKADKKADFFEPQIKAPTK